MVSVVFFSHLPFRVHRKIPHRHFYGTVSLSKGTSPPQTRSCFTGP